jgi:hypothetical protein
MYSYSEPKSKHTYKRLLTYLLLLILVIVAVTFSLKHKPTVLNMAEIKSGYGGYCIDDHHDSNTKNTPIFNWQCNGSDAQNWIIKNNQLIHDKNYCLTITNNGSVSGSEIVSDICNGETGQVWTSAIDGYENPASALCLSTPKNEAIGQLVVASCKNLTLPQEAWMPATYNKNDTTGASTNCSGGEGQLVACNAAKQYITWLSGKVNHNNLLNTYSDGNGYEEWCADFISYIYKESGYPFINGERDDWDEYYAPNIQNMGFTYHAVTNYVPKTGDVAFYDYNGGHVEIVAIGGNKPIFIYGDSGTTDPTTGNGEMTENTIVNDGSEGQLLYYLSPN